MKQTLLSLLMMLLSVIVFAEEVEIDGIYYNLINKVKVAEVVSLQDDYDSNLVIPAIVVITMLLIPSHPLETMLSRAAAV